MNIALPKDFEEVIQRLMISGGYNSATEVIGAALQNLEAHEIHRSAPVYPPGSLAHLYDEAANQAELMTIGGSTLHVEPE